MSSTCMPETEDMPMCERKVVLDRLQEMVDELENVQKSTRQVPRVLIRSDVCNCKTQKGNTGCYDLQKERAKDKMPPQFFEYPDVSSKSKEVHNVGPAGDAGCAAKAQGQSLCSGLDFGSCPLKPKTQPQSEGATKCNDPKANDTSKGNEQVSGCNKQKTKDKTSLCGDPVLPKEREVKPHPLIPVPKPSTSYELRGSLMIVGCHCLKRNGMQHDCQRTECQGKKECLKFPAPVCQPSGLAPPIIKVSPIIQLDEPDCGPKRTRVQTKTQIEQRKILLNYARAQYQSNPPMRKGGEVPCKYHKKGFYYVRPLQKPAKTQTEEANSPTDKK